MLTTQAWSLVTLVENKMSGNVWTLVIFNLVNTTQHAGTRTTYKFSARAVTFSGVANSFYLDSNSTGNMALVKPKNYFKKADPCSS